MNVIIAGGREFNDYELLKSKCDEIIKDDNISIICGEARGADSLGKKYGIEKGYSIVSMPADWNTYGKSAGYKRNEEMAIKAKEDNGILIAFWDGKSRGTEHMINLAGKHKLVIHVVRY